MIAIKRDANGDGGSVSLVDQVAEGDSLSVSAPENYFALADEAKSCVLIAGGIGITPILAMVHHLTATERDFKLIYCTRSPETTAFIAELSVPELAGRVLIHHDHGERDRSLDLRRCWPSLPRAATSYCCGPRPLMQGVREMTRHWPAGTVHFEDFGTSAPPPQQAPDGTFTVHLAKKGIDVAVPPGVSILEALRQCGVAVPSSAQAGTCGSCRTRLVSGEAEHRDFVLDDDEHATDIMICVSRAKSKVLTLDI